MSASKKEILDWLDQANKDGATHLVIVCDTIDNEDYPVEVMPDEEVDIVVANFSGINRQKIVNVIDLSIKKTS